MNKGNSTIFFNQKKKNMVNEFNFYEATLAHFKGCKRPKRQPDYVSKNRYGEVSSEYWYTSKGVIRCSNHWTRIHKVGPGKIRAFECGRVANCYWYLSNPSPLKGYEGTPCGFCAWGDFKKRSI